MPRPNRPDLPGVPVHIVQRTAGHGPCFLADGDRERFLGWLRDAAERESCAIHAYVLMGNHVHLLMTPCEPGAMSRTMHSLGTRYVPYFNARHGREGVLWERRYRSCLIDSDRYLLNCHRYIELNPVRAGIAARPGDYRWSSYGHLALGARDPVVTAHPGVIAMGADPVQRRQAYVDLIEAVGPPDEWSALRRASRRDGAYGSDEFLHSLGLRRPRNSLPSLTPA